MNSDEESNTSETESDDGYPYENPNVHLSKFPKPFRGKEDENIYDFIKDLETALYYNRVPASCQVKILKKLVKDDAKCSVRESESLDENFKYLKKVFGNPRAVWMKEKNEFLKNSKDEIMNWTGHFSQQRKMMLVKVCAFLRSAESLASKFEDLKGHVYSPHTIDDVMAVLPPKINEKIIEKETSGFSCPFTTFQTL